jgi:hypothetical protein
VKVQVASATPLIASVLWVAALLAEPGALAAGSVLLIGVTLLALSSVAVVGMVLSGGRWARLTAFEVVACCATVAVIRPIDLMWVVALAATAVALAALFSGSVVSSIRRLPAAAGPPERAVVVPLALLSFPFVVGLAAWEDPTPATLVVGLTAPVAALWFARVLPGGLLGVRAVWPTMAVGLALIQDPAPAVASALTGALIAALAWGRSVKVAFHPPRETGTSFPIPPELAPREVLDAARLDEKGRPRR